MWDQVSECGVLNNFDIRHYSSDDVGTRTYTEPGNSMLLELLELKEFCNWRSRRVYLDRIEPFVWMLAEMCLGTGAQWTLVAE